MGSEDTDNPEGVALVGDWPALGSPAASLRLGSWEVTRFVGGSKALKRLLTASLITWLLVGAHHEDETVELLHSAGRTVRPSLRLAMLGDPADWARCERWLRRGCVVYLDVARTTARVLAALTFASQEDVLVTDACFQRELWSRHPILISSKLTKREIDVVRLLSVGLTNQEIAARLGLSENTVAFHVSNLLGKLVARNRVEVAERVRVLGL